jgi:DNA replication protein DnaC
MLVGYARCSTDAQAADDKQLSKTIARYGRIDLLLLDELGYKELDRRGAELLFQVLTDGTSESVASLFAGSSTSSCRQPTNSYPNNGT